tara:strand:+ start:684 stop:1274 length:591 start_codon:yes stop_codon:yes gene_type:complete
MGLGLDIISVLAGAISAATAVMGIWLKLRYDDKKSKQLNYDPNLHDSVITSLVSVIDETASDRAYILEFHNGEHYFSGKSQQKLSCTYEALSEGISSESCNLQNIRISNFHGMVKSIAQDQTFRCKDIGEYSGDMGFRAFMQNRGVKSIFAKPIKTVNGKIIGIMVLEYVKESRRWSREAEEFIDRESRIVSGYLI